MKANRKFVWDDEAVSPVIAVILMVAITVVLAATVFVLVSDIGSQTASNAPNIVFAQDETGDGISVTSAAAGANWNRLEIKTSHSGDFRFDPDGTINDRPTVAMDAGTFVAITTVDIPVKPSDKVCFWTDGANTNVKIEMRDAVASAALGQGWTFSSTGSTLKASC